MGSRSIRIMIGAILLLGLLQGVARAGQPADLTSLWRICPPFYQVDVEGDSQFIYISQPVSDKLSLELYDWHGQGSYLHEVGVTIRANQNLQVALIHDQAKASSAEHSLMVDWQKGKIGLGVLVPLDSEKDVLAGPRVKLSPTLTACATLGEGRRPLVGLTYYRSGNCLLAAYSDETWWIRASKQYGPWIPELRYKRRAGENVFGISLAWTK